MPIPWLPIALVASAIISSLAKRGKTRYPPISEAYIDPYDVLGLGGQKPDLLRQALSGVTTTDQTSIQDMIQNSLEQYEQQTLPVITPEFSPLVGAVRAASEARLRQASALPFGYETTLLSGLSRQQQASQEALANRLSGAGLLGSPIEAAGEAGLEAERYGQIARMRGELPLLERSLRDQDIAQASGLAQAFGRGEKTAGTRRTTTTGRTTGRVTGREEAPPPLLLPIPRPPLPQGPAPQDYLLQILAILAGAGVFQKKPPKK